MLAITISYETTYRDETFKSYQTEVNRYKVLNEEEEKNLIARAAKGDKKAITSLVNHNLRFVISVAKHYQGLGLDLMDLINEGNIGLYKAAQTVSEDKENRFIFYAVHKIRAQITAALDETSRVVRLPRNHRNDKYQAVSGDAKLGSDEDDDYTLFSSMSRNEDKADKYDDIEYLSAKLANRLKRLNDKEYHVICSLFGIGTREKTQYELSLEYGVTEERIRQIKLQAIEKMQA